MDTQKLNQTIRQLALTAPNRSPVISAFFNLSHPRADHADELMRWSKVAGATLRGQARADFEDALQEVMQWLETETRPDARGIALFCRWGDEPFFIPLQFRSPITTSYYVDNLPQVYPLVELLDSYDRFVVVIATERKARIIETCIGSVTESILTERPELRERIGREWTKEHYQNHTQQRTEQFMKEKIQVLDSVVTRGQHDHIMLVGQSSFVARLYRSLPKRLQEKVFNTLTVGPDRQVSTIVQDAMDAFVRYEQDLSQENVKRLESAVAKGGLGVVGYDAARTALENGQAEMLLLDQAHNLPEIKEELTRLAILSGVEIETVSGCDLLKSFGGVGCLLRFALPDLPEKVRAA